MDLRRIRKITQSNIDRLIDENLYRGITNNDKTIVKVQCMDKDFWVTFDFAQEEATIENRLWRKDIENNSNISNMFRQCIFWSGNCR